MLVCWLHEPEKKRKKCYDSYSYVLVQQQKYHSDSTGKIKSNPLEPFSNFSDDVAVLRAHENCCRFATL